MASLNEEIKIEEVNLAGGFGGFEEQQSENLPAKVGFWSRMKSFWLQDIDWNAKIDLNKEIKVELTPAQQKVEDEINDFLHQKVTFESFKNFLFKEIKF
jgi:hypothetical protein